MMASLLKRIKILHVMIFIAVMGFSVRLIDVAEGFSSLMNAAQAEEAKPAEAHEGDASAAAKTPEEGTPPSQDDLADAAKPEDGKTEAEKNEALGDDLIFGDEEDDSKWRDANDSDMGTANIRMELFKDLSARRKAIEAQEQELSTREALLKAAEKEIDQKYQELTQLRAEIEKLLVQQSDEEQKRVTSLVKIYEGMKPKEAARIFDTLDLDVLVSVMSRMSERKLSPVLAAMNPERARTITILLAEEKQLPSLPGQENSN